LSFLTGFVVISLLVVTVGVIGGTLLLLPTIIFAAIVWGAARLGARRSKQLGRLILLLMLALPVLAWTLHRHNYRMRADAIVARIRKAPKLGPLRDPPDVLLSRGFAVPEYEFFGPNCFPNLFEDFHGKIQRWGPSPAGWHSEPLPSRYLEFDQVANGPSAFGDRRKTGGRGPYDLWLVENGRKRLVDVFFLTGDGQSVIPPPVIFFWVEPANVRTRELRPALKDFLRRNTGRCPPNPRAQYPR